MAMEAAEKKCVTSADAEEAVENKGEVEGIKNVVAGCDCVDVIVLLRL